jgi:hypothetical protein
LIKDGITGLRVKAVLVMALLSIGLVKANTLTSFAEDEPCGPSDQTVTDIICHLKNNLLLSLNFYVNFLYCIDVKL